MPARRNLVGVGIAAVGLAGGLATRQILVHRGGRRPTDGPSPPAPAPVGTAPASVGTAPASVGTTPAEGAGGASRVDAALLPGVEIHVLVLSDGTRMRVLARGAGRPILLVHGIMLSADIWSRQLRDLGDTGYRVVAPDLRGHGESTVGSGGLALDRVVDDLAELIGRLGLDDVVLVGHSMGGMLALRLLTRTGPPAPVGALGLVATSASPVGGRGIPGLRAVIGLAGPVLGAAGRLSRLVPGPSLPDSEVGDPLARVTFGSGAAPADVRLIRRVTALVPARVTMALLLQLVSFDAAPVVDRVTVPTTVVVGCDDVMTPPRHARALAAAIPGAELVELPGCGHMVMLERPDQLDAALRRLAGTSAPSLP
jgi:pimeloyl-ACP methyl ester carboxylesterase